MTVNRLLTLACEAAGGAAPLAARLSLSPQHVRDWRRRNSIPSRYHVSFVRTCEDLGLREITFEALARAHSEPAP